MILFSIIIPTCSRNDMLALCLARLAPGAQTLDASLYEVIVTDDGKNNEAKALIQASYDWAQWISGPKRGPAANRNNGARLAQGEWLVFTDDDCLPDTNWLQAYSDGLHQYPEAEAFEGAILPDDWNLLKKDMAECPVNDKGGCFWSANIMVDKQLFQQIGGFDEQFKIAAQEDQDLQKRLMKYSQIVFLNNAIILHPVRIVSLIKKIKSISSTTINWHRYYRKDHNFLSTLFKAGTSQLLALGVSLKKRKIKSALFHSIYLTLTIPILLKKEFTN